MYKCVFTDSGEEEGLEEFELRVWVESRARLENGRRELGEQSEVRSHSSWQ